MIGRRVIPLPDDVSGLAPGDYGFHARTGVWVVRMPGALICAYKVRAVTEHVDGTITVDSAKTSSRPKFGRGEYGFLDHGEFKPFVPTEIR
jgi:hypothetical protein